ncbi:carbon storage regulator [Lysobacter sp. FW306-1B-D06B]|uniref:carbon storage regulator n=1 Tax=Lysobacter sp. FW306-1B-D06B TaxID=3140250 RepID=UPI0031406FCE
MVLERSLGERVRIGHDIRLTVVGFDRAGAVRLGTEAPPDVAVHREEIYAKIQQQKAAVAQAPATAPQVVYRRRRTPTGTS